MFSSELNTLKTAYADSIFPSVEIYTGNEDGIEWLTDTEANYIRVRVKEGMYGITQHEELQDTYWISAVGEVLARVDGVTNAKKWLLSKLSRYDNITMYDDTKEIVEAHGVEISQTDIEFILIQFELRKIDTFENCNAPCVGC